MSQINNEDELVTKEELSEFYQGIFPYLGGSFPTPIVNKFSKGDLYSTDEKIIGQWIDGKPLYQKSFDWKTLSNSSTSRHYVVFEDLTSLNIDSFVYAWGMWDDGDIYKSIPASDNDYKIGPVYGYPSSKDLSLVVSGISSNITAQMHIIYTKTTDSAISIGDGNDYSTNEQVVGTWIDGKPIYQCTFSGSWALSSSTTHCYYASISPLVSGVDKVIDAKGYQNSRGFYMPLIVDNRSGDWMIKSVDNETLSYITIQYTKTTDA